MKVTVAGSTIWRLIRVCVGKEVGRRLMEQAEELLRKAGCPKINLQIRSANKEAADFYASLGYLQDDVISLGKRLDPD